MVGRLVEQEEVRARGERLREVQPHAPAAGEARDRVAVARVGDAEAREQLGRAGARRVAADRLVALVQLGERVAVGRVLALLRAKRRLDLAQLDVAVEHEVDRGAIDRRRLLRDVRDRPARREVDRSRLGVELAAQEREQARLAAAVGPHDADAVARVDGQRRVVEQAQRAAGEGEVGEADHEPNEVRRR